MIGIALEGGAERSAFTAGVLNQLMQYHFDAAAISGTSAGAGCALSYCANQCGTVVEMMTLPKHERYFGVRHMLQTGRFLNLERMAKSFAERTDFAAFSDSAIHVDFAATRCEDGKAVYLSVHGTKRHLFRTLMASCALPVICSPVQIDNAHYVDGSIAAPIPFAHLLESGCEKVLVVLTGAPGCRPTDYRKFRLLLRQCYAQKYPALYAAILERTREYQAQVQQMQRAVQEKRVFVLRPEIAPIPLFTGDHGKIRDYYAHGVALTQKKWHEIEAWLAADHLSTQTCAPAASYQS